MRPAKIRNFTGGSKAGVDVLSDNASVQVLLCSLQALRYETAGDAEVQIWNEAVNEVVSRIFALRHVSGEQRNLAVQAYLIGLAEALYGDKAAVTTGLRIGYSSKDSGRSGQHVYSLARLFRILLTVGRNHGHAVSAAASR